MPQVVKAYSPQARMFEETIKDFPKIVWIEQGARGTAEHPRRNRRPSIGRGFQLAFNMQMSTMSSKLIRYFLHSF